MLGKNYNQCTEKKYCIIFSDMLFLKKARRKQLLCSKNDKTNIKKKTDQISVSRITCKQLARLYKMADRQETANYFIVYFFVASLK